jgi:hypothetical protein
MSSLAQYSPWHEAYAGRAGQRCPERDKKLETEGKTDKAAGKLQNAVGGLKDAVRGK